MNFNLFIFNVGKCVGDCTGCCGNVTLKGMAGGYSWLNGEYELQSDLQYDRNYYKFTTMVNFGSGPEETILYLHWTTSTWTVINYFVMFLDA